MLQLYMSDMQSICDHAHKLLHETGSILVKTTAQHFGLWWTALGKAHFVRKLVMYIMTHVIYVWMLWIRVWKISPKPSRRTLPGAPIRNIDGKE